MGELIKDTAWVTHAQSCGVPDRESSEAPLSTRSGRQGNMKSAQVGSILHQHNSIESVGERHAPSETFEWFFLFSLCIFWLAWSAWLVSYSLIDEHSPGGPADGAITHLISCLALFALWFLSTHPSEGGNSGVSTDITDSLSRLLFFPVSLSFLPVPLLSF